MSKSPYDRRTLAKMLQSHGMAYLTHRRFAVFQEIELYPRRTGLKIEGGRIDILGVSGRGFIIGIEIKTCRADFQTDHKAGKWLRYKPYVNQLYFLLPPEMKVPQELLDDPDVGVLQPTVGGFIRVVKRCKWMPVAGKLRKSTVLSLIFRAADKTRMTNRRARWPTPTNPT
jgi:hypothetical protein